MELKASSPKRSSLSPPDCVSDHGEKELSDEDDDDRNHKHRRRDTRSQSLERDALDKVYTRPYRKYNKLLQNGHPFRENESQASESWRNYNISPLEKDLTAKFERRHLGLPSLSRTSLDLNQRIRPNQTFYGDLGPGRGSGRDSGSWNQRDSRFSSIDIASQMVQPASMASSLFTGRGIPSVSNSQSASWSAFGLIPGPGVPNGGLETLHPIGLQRTLRPPLNSSLNMGIARQRCRDFEERGFCLRGDMCPMEHGVNRIVVEDVQSLSQFNLTVPLPSAPLLATPARPGGLSSVGAPSTTLTSSKGVHSRGNQPGVTDDELGLNGAYSNSDAAGADLYDPDQPLWNSNGLETSYPAALHSSNDENESLFNNDSSNRHYARASDSADNELPMRNAGTTNVSRNTSQSVWGRIGGLKNRANVKEKINAMSSSSDFLENENKEDKETLLSPEGISHRGKQITEGDANHKAMDASSTKIQNVSMRNIRRPSQKALRTLFVNNIPQKINRREALLSHFRKFGEVVDVYIPLNSERAFVQFSKREEAEAALKSPDAVMGNRFIKLWWANRDSIPDDGMSSGSKIYGTSNGLTTASLPAHSSVANKMKDNILQSAALKGGNILTDVDVSLSATDHPKPVFTNSPKIPPPVQKKMDSLEQLKEELRKKQELLDQKRNDFRRKLNKLEKQATGIKDEVVSGQAAKRLKMGIATDLSKTTARSSDPAVSVASPRAEVMADKNKLADNIVSHSQKLNTATVLQESKSFKQQIGPLAPGGPSFFMNRYKLDNRPTTFRIIPPLPAGFADVAVLNEHFSSYGDLSTVELEDGEVQEGGNDSDTSKKFSAWITFTTRSAAERAFLNGKCWQGHNLQFTWLIPSSSSNDLGNKEKSSPAFKGSSDTDVLKEEQLSSLVPQEVAASGGNGESENSERKSSIEHTEFQGVSQPSSPTRMSGEEESPKDNVG